MAYSLRVTVDTWLKQSTAQGSTLPDTQRQFVAGGTVLPIAAYELVGTDHLRVTLGKTPSGQQIFFQGRNTWFVYRPVSQILRDGQPIVLPNAPRPNPPPASVFTFRCLRDTWLKQSTAPSSQLPNNQRQFLTRGTVLPLSAFEQASDNHIRLTLGVDAQGRQAQFQGRNTWFAFAPDVQLLRNGQPIASPSPAPSPAPSPSPSPAPSPAPSPSPSPQDITPAPGTRLLLKAKLDTWLKLSLQQASELPANQRQFIDAGTLLPLATYATVEPGHLRITLGINRSGQQVQFQGRNTWLVFRPAVQVLKDGMVVTFPEPPPPDDRRRINDRGLEILKSFEGLKLEAYLDPVGIWTIGYGTTRGVRPGMVITVAQAEQFLKEDLARFEAAVNDLVTVPLTSDQFSALVSFTYNVGEGALANSTLLRLLNQGDYNGAANQFLRWNLGDGVELPGLTRRRRAERALFLGQNYRVFL